MYGGGACTHVVDKSSSGQLRPEALLPSLRASLLLLLLGQDAGNWSTQHSVSCLYTPHPGYNHLLPSILTDALLSSLTVSFGRHV